MFGSNLNCTNTPPLDTPSNAGIAGAGVILSFVITAVLVLSMSASLIVQQAFSWKIKPSVLRRKLLNGYSDQQILTGISIQSVGLAQMDTLVPYHFFIIWMLSLLSMAIHNATLLALVGDFRKDWVLRWLRNFLMFVNLVLSCIYGIFMLEVVQKDLEDSTLPVACAWQVNGNTSGASYNATLSYVGTIAVICGNCIVFAASTWYLHDRQQRFFRWTQLVGIVCMVASAVAAAVRVIMVSSAFGTATTNLRDEGEKDWSFGTMVSLVLLLLPLMSLLELARGEIRDPIADDDKAPILLDNTEMGRVRPLSYQPAPFHFSRAKR